MFMILVDEDGEIKIDMEHHAYWLRDDDNSYSQERIQLVASLVESGRVLETGMNKAKREIGYKIQYV